jgi:hypothetical protein
MRQAGLFGLSDHLKRLSAHAIETFNLAIFLRLVPSAANDVV